MRHATLFTSDRDFSQLLNLARNLDYIVKIEIDNESEKIEVSKHIREGFEEMLLIKSGVKKGIRINEFLDEL